MPAFYWRSFAYIDNICFTYRVRGIHIDTPQYSQRYGMPSIRHIIMKYIWSRSQSRTQHVNPCKWWRNYTTNRFSLPDVKNPWQYLVFWRWLLLYPSITKRQNRHTKKNSRFRYLWGSIQWILYKSRSILPTLYSIRLVYCGLFDWFLCEAFFACRIFVISFHFFGFKCANFVNSIIDHIFYWLNSNTND